MLEINLLPLREARRKADVRSQVTQVGLVLVLAVGAIALVHAGMKDDLALARARVAQMDHDILQFKPQLDRVEAFKKQKKNLKKKISIIEDLDRARSGPVRVLSELATRTPDRLWLTGLETKGDALSMKGKSLDNELVALFLRSLDESPYFKDVDLDSTKVANQGQLRLVNFVIRARMDTAPDKKKKAPATAGATG